MSSCSSPAPLTAAEQELQRIKVTEVKFESFKMLPSSCVSHIMLIPYASTFSLQDKVVWVCNFSAYKFCCVCLKDIERTDLKTFSHVLRMNADELELQQHERGFVTMCLTCWPFIFSHASWHTRTEISVHLICFSSSLGYNGVWLGQKGTDASRSCIPITRRGQTSSAAAQAETYQLHTAGEPWQKTHHWMHHGMQNATDCNHFIQHYTMNQCLSVKLSVHDLTWTKLACVCCVAEAGCRERDHWAGSHQTYRDARASLQDSHRFTQIPLLHLQTFPSGSAAGGTGSVQPSQCWGHTAWIMPKTRFRNSNFLLIIYSPPCWWKVMWSVSVHKAMKLKQHSSILLNNWIICGHDSIQLCPPSCIKLSHLEYMGVIVCFLCHTVSYIYSKDVNIRCLSRTSFFSSVHIFNAWVHLQYQRKDAVFQL